MSRANDRVFTMRPPFTVSANGSAVLDGLGFVVCAFHAGERIGFDEAARVVCAALNHYFDGLEAAK